MKNSGSRLTLVEGQVYAPPVILFLSTTLILTLARAMSLPYLVVYCAERFGMSVADVGLALGGALIANSLFSLYGGLFALAFGAAFSTGSLAVFFTAIVVVNLTYAVIDIAVKSGIGALVGQENRGAVFSVKYTLTNIGCHAGLLADRT